jgi:hypothetical protein
MGPTVFGLSDGVNYAVIATNRITVSAELAFDNTATGMTATTVQDAVDEIYFLAGPGASISGLTDTNIGVLAAGQALVWDGVEWINKVLDADEVAYDNSGSGLTATDLQDAIDELAATAGGTLTQQEDQATLAVSTNYGTTGITLAATPKNKPQVYVNGIRYTVGSGVRTEFFYFSADGGTTARSTAAMVAGDTLYCGSGRLFDLSNTTMTITLIYNS